MQHSVEELARHTNRSRSFIVEEAVMSSMRDRADYIRELDEAVKSAQSGVGHSSEQIFSWMRSWGTEAELASLVPDIKPAR